MTWYKKNTEVSGNKTAYHHRIDGFYKFWVNVKTSEIEEIDVHRWFVLDEPERFGISEQDDLVILCHSIQDQMEGLQKVDIEKWRDLNDKLFENERILEDRVINSGDWVRVLVGYNPSGHNIMYSSNDDAVRKAVKILESEGIYTFRLEFDSGSEYKSLSGNKLKSFIDNYNWDFLYKKEFSDGVEKNSWNFFLMTKSSEVIEKEEFDVDEYMEHGHLNEDDLLSDQIPKHKIWIYKNNIVVDINAYGKNNEGLYLRVHEFVFSNFADFWRGRYDAEKNLITILPPEEYYERMKKLMRLPKIPKSLLYALRSKYNTNNIVGFQCNSSNSSFLKTSSNYDYDDDNIKYQNIGHHDRDEIMDASFEQRNKMLDTKLWIMLGNNFYFDNAYDIHTDEPLMFDIRTHYDIWGRESLDSWRGRYSPFDDCISISPPAKIEARVIQSGRDIKVPYNVLDRLENNFGIKRLECCYCKVAGNSGLTGLKKFAGVPLKSKLYETLDQKLSAIVPVQSVLDILNSPKFEVNRDEIFWSGIEDYLNSFPDKKQRIEKVDILDFLTKTKPVIKSMNYMDRSEDNIYDRSETINKPYFESLSDAYRKKTGSNLSQKEVGEAIVKNYGFDILLNIDEYFPEDLESFFSDLSEEQRIEVRTLIENRDESVFNYPYIVEIILSYKNHFMDNFRVRRNSYEDRDGISYDEQVRNEIYSTYDLELFSKNTVLKKRGIELKAIPISFNNNSIFYDVYCDDELFSKNLSYYSLNNDYDFLSKIEEELFEGEPNSRVYEEYSLPGGEKYKETLITLPSHSSEFNSVHFQKKNIIAHYRSKGRKDIENNDGLFLEEIQSDWHERGRKEGYSDFDDVSSLCKKYEYIIPRVKEWGLEVAEDLKKYIVTDGELLEGDMESFDNSIDGFIHHINSIKCLSDLPEAKRILKNISSVYFSTSSSAEYQKIIRYDPDLNDVIKEFDSHYNKVMHGQNIPRGPFSSTDDWVGIVAKKAVEMAIKENKKFISWTPGFIQKLRYGGAQQQPNKVVIILDTKYNKRYVEFVGKTFEEFLNKFGQFNCTAELHFDNELLNEIELSEVSIKSGIPFELLQRLLPSKITEDVEQNYFYAKSEEIKIKKEAMETFYDEIVPKVFKNIFKKYGGKLEKKKIFIGDRKTAYEDIQRLYNNLDVDRYPSVVINYPEYSGTLLTLKRKPEHSPYEEVNIKLSREKSDFYIKNGIDKSVNKYHFIDYSINDYPELKRMFPDTLISKIKIRYDNSDKFCYIGEIAGDTIVFATPKKELTEFFGKNEFSSDTKYINKKLGPYIENDLNELEYSPKGRFGYLECYCLPITEDMKSSIDQKGFYFYGENIGILKTASERIDIKTALVLFHKYFYLWSEMDSFGLEKYFPSDFYLYKEKCLYFAKNICEEFIPLIQEWNNLHDEDNPELFFESRYNLLFNSVSDGEYPVESINDSWAFSFTNFETIMKSMGNEEFFDFILDIHNNKDAEKFWKKEDFVELYVEEKRDLGEDVVDNVSDWDLKEWIIERFESGDYPEDIKLDIVLSNGIFKEKIKEQFIDIGMFDVVSDLELGKSNREESGKSIPTNYEFLQISKSVLNKMKSALASKDIAMLGHSISLAIQLEHNSGEIIKDHFEDEGIRLDDEFLESLNYIDIDKEKEKIDKMISSIGKSREELFKEKKDKSVKDKFLDQSTKELWEETARLEHFGKRNWYNKVGEKIPGGLAKDKSKKDFDPKKLEEGKKVEMEHTSDSDIAEEIAMDHLTEDEDYYKKLKRVEK